MFKATVKKVINTTPGVVLLRLKPEKAFEFKPGQFIQLLIEKEGNTIKKSYSITSLPPHKKYFELCIKVVEGGYTSNYLKSLKPGHELNMDGPFGIFTLQENINNDLVFLATGAGISSLKPMIKAALTKTAHDIWLFFGVRAEQEIIYRDELEALAASHKNFHFIPVLSNSSNPDFEHGYVQDVFKKLVKPNAQDIYICGLYIMVDEVKAMCKELGYSDEKTHYEKYI